MRAARANERMMNDERTNDEQMTVRAARANERMTNDERTISV
ncbi:hypothetical protein [Capnocytophaga sp. oral taxon 323]|nr:hypothetical protein [Capnocytophaga sp. oral taxon 323]